MDAVHSQGHGYYTDGPMRVLGMVFLLQSNPNAPQQVNFKIQNFAHDNMNFYLASTAYHSNG